ncbi:DUF305 domain-containing protein [Nocardioidaceae bacterium]|nr:DUF305 domain-containing protein [Nocardioidaceae bacterium]
MIGTALLSGCVYAEASSATAIRPAAASSPVVAPSTESESESDPAGGDDLSRVHDEQDAAYVLAAVEHHELTGRLADLMLAEARATDEHRALAELLVATQASRVEGLHDLLAVWDRDTHLPARAVDGETALGTVEESLALLEEQRDSPGFAPFWLLTVAEHQQALLQPARRTAARGTSPDARAHAETFVRDHALVAARLAELGA